MNNKPIAFDEDGYLLELSDWNADVATIIAKQEGITELTAAHWIVINNLRKFYDTFHVKVISMRAFLNELKKEVEPSKCTSIYLYTLFPKGLTQVSKIAALPKSTRCSKDAF